MPDESVYNATDAHDGIPLSWALGIGADMRTFAKLIIAWQAAWIIGLTTFFAIRYAMNPIGQPLVGPWLVIMLLWFLPSFVLALEYLKNRSRKRLAVLVITLNGVVCFSLLGYGLGAIAALEPAFDPLELNSAFIGIGAVLSGTMNLPSAVFGLLVRLGK
jgi:hypothetical protein